MTALRLVKLAPPRLARLDERADFAKPEPAAPICPPPDQPDPHAVLFRSACARLAADAAAHRDALAAEAAGAVERIVRAVAPALLDAGAGDSFRALLRSLAGSGDVEVEIRGHPDTIATLSRADARAVKFVADEAVAPGDFHATWPHGGMARNANVLIESVLAALSPKTDGAANGRE
jgi:hypothetical protein